MKNLGTAIVVCLFGGAISATPSFAASAIWLGDDKPPHAAGNGLTYSIEHRRLVAEDSRTGRWRWTFGRDIEDNANPCDSVRGFIFASGHQVYTLSKTNTIYALQAGTGRLLWRGKMQRNEVCGLGTDTGNLVIFGSDRITWYDASRGRVIKNILLKHVPDTLPLMDQDVVLVGYIESGAYMADRTDAYDRRSGRLLWTSLGKVRRITAGKVELMQYYPEQDPTPHTSVTRIVVDKRVGKVLNSITTVP